LRFSIYVPNTPCRILPSLYLSSTAIDLHGSWKILDALILSYKPHATTKWAWYPILVGIQPKPSLHLRPFSPQCRGLVYYVMSPDLEPPTISDIGEGTVARCALLA
jgi:hypothetical protein